MKERQSNVELLRIISIIGVIVLHYNNKSFGGALLSAQNLPLNHTLLVLLESAAICAVDLFVMISGYFSVKKAERSWLKVAELIVQVAVLSEVKYLLSGVLWQGSVTPKGAMMALIPNNYFVILYCALYLISPLINLAMESICPEYKRRALVISLVLFAVLPWGVDIMNALVPGDWNGLSTVGLYGSQSGYTIVNFVLMYCIGGFLRDADLSHVKRPLLAIAIVADWAALSLIARKSTALAWSYCNPLVIAEAVLYLLLFVKTDMGTCRPVNSLSKACFTCFLMHPFFLRMLHVQKYTTGNPAVMLLHITASAVGIFLACYVIYLIYTALTAWIWKRLKNDRFVLKYTDRA